MADSVFKDIPEIYEVSLGEALLARTDVLSTFRELGPPDLCHVVKGARGQADVGSYHFVSGIDASSSASLAAYINSLMYSIEETQGWLSKGPTWKVKNGSYCCFNAFSRVDVRVDVKIPGGVVAYALDLRGERHEATPEIWQETYLSAILRAILYSDDPTYYLEAYRRLDPIPSPEAELRFLQAAEVLFPKGWQVGSDPEIQVATVVSNHLTAGIMKYFGDSGRFHRAANLFEKLMSREPEVAPLLAKSYIGMNEEVKAVQIMANAMKQTPNSYLLLHAQCDFLRSKGKTDWAVQLAQQAVNCAPSEFVTWEKLTEIYIELGEYESALLTLNSCPMFTFNGRDAHRTLTASRLHIPVKRAVSDVLPVRERTDDDEADPALQRLPAPGLRGTWARAYTLLTKLVSQIGWDELLKTRSAVFVMEEEYRMQKAHAEISAVQTNGNGSAGLPTAEDADDDASTRGMHSARSSTGRVHEGEGADTAEENVPAPSISETDETAVERQDGLPTIRISTESAREAKAAAAEEQERLEKESELTNGQETPLQQPAQAAAGESDGSGDPDTALPNANGNVMQEAFSFSNKRLCERWLDNLFMVLYEDLRVWTIFRAEVAHFKTQHVAYRKTGAEWEILGDLGLRLQHKEEAKEAYQRALDSTRYSAKPWWRLLETYADEGDLMRTLQSGIRVAAYAHAEHAELVYPTQIARCFFKLQQIHGHEKIWNTLRSMGLPEPILQIMKSYLLYGKTFKVEGYDF